MKTQAVLLSVVLLAFPFPSALAADSPLHGKWKNTHSNTRSVVELEIAISGNGGGSFWWTGRTHPENSVYGPYDLHVFHESVSDRSPGKSAVVVHDSGFSVSTFTMRADGSSLTVEKFTRFTDDSGRANYRERLVFRRN